LFIDQFEELFALADEGHRRDFIELLARAADDPRLRVLATLRADFLPQGMADPVLAPLLQAGTFPLGPPGPAALTDMIRRPAERAGLALHEGLADAILQDAGGDPGEALPLVAFCLEELYRRTASSGQRLTTNAYRAVGGLRGAIGRRAGELLGDVKSAEEADLETALPRVFRALVHIDAAGKAARQRASRDALVTAPAPVPRLVETLINGRLLSAEGAGSYPVITLTHEALLQEWPALCDWLERNRAQMQSIQRLLLGLAAAEREDRKHAAQRLRAIASAAAEAVPEVVPRLATALRDADRDVRLAAVGALGKVGPAAAEGAPALVGALGDADKEVRRAAAATLGQIRPAAAVPALVGALRDADRDVRRAAVATLGEIGPAAAEAVPALVSALNDPMVGVRGGAAWALGRIGPAAAEAVPALAGALKATTAPFVSRAAVEALGKIGPVAVPVLVGALGNANEEVRRVAAWALGRIGPAAAEAVPALVGAFKKAAASSVRPVAAAALGKIGPAAVPALVGALGDADKEVRRVAAATLGEIGPAAAEALPALAGVVEDTVWQVRWAAAAALGEVGPAAAEAAPEVVPALVAALRDAETEVRWAADEALRRIKSRST
jgi:HEAT repeat protein